MFAPRHSFGPYSNSNHHLALVNLFSAIGATDDGAQQIKAGQRAD